MTGDYETMLDEQAINVAILLTQTEVFNGEKMTTEVSVIYPTHALAKLADIDFVLCLTDKTHAGTDVHYAKLTAREMKHVALSMLDILENPEFPKSKPH